MTNNRLQELHRFQQEDPNDPFIPYAIAIEEYSLGMTTVAIEHMVDLINTQPDYLPAYYQSAKWLIESGRMAEAGEFIETGITKAIAAENRKTERELKELKEEID